jgi:hypothetical protein
MGDDRSDVSSTGTLEAWHWSTWEAVAIAVAVLGGAVLMVLSHLLLIAAG